MATPTAPIALAGDPSSATARLAPGGSTARRRGARPAAPRLHRGDRRSRRARRGQPRLVAAGDDLGARRPGAGAGRGRRAARPTPTRSPPCCAVCNEARVPVTAAAGRSGVCGASVPVHGGVVLDLTAPGRHRRRRRHQPRGLDVLPGTFGDQLEAELRDRARRSPSATGRSRSTLSTVGGWLACRRRRPALHPLRQDRGHGRRPRRRPRRRPDDHHRRHAPPGRRARPHPALRRQRGHARRHHRRPPPRRTRRPPTSAAPPTASPPSPTASTPAAASSAAAPRPAVLRLYDAVEAEPHLRHRRHATCCSCSTRASPRSSTPRWRSSPRSAPAPRRSTPRSSSSGSSTATT